MAKSPVSVEKVECEGDGKQKYVIREREYDILSKAGLGVMVKVVGTILGFTIAILTAYYTAEAGQNERVTAIGATQHHLDDRQTRTEKAFTDALNKLDTTLHEQRVVLQATREALVKVDTSQTNIHESYRNLQQQTNELAKQVSVLADKVRKLEER